ncbi:MAG: hypothetical protein ACYDAE_23715 [Steroidobacteraceae bacterium]
MNAIPVSQRRPAGICANCWVTWRARRPRPQAVFCHHFGNAARETPKGWKVLEGVNDGELAALRAAAPL